MNENKPEIVRCGALNVQVCVPENWTDHQAVEFAEKHYPCGTTLGWCVRKDPELLGDDPERNPCSKRKGCVHIMMDC